MNNRNPWQLKKSKYWEACQCCLAGSSKRAPRIFIFSIALGAEYLFYVKFIATRAPTFFGYIISVLTNVSNFTRFFLAEVSNQQKKTALKTCTEKQQWVTNVFHMIVFVLVIFDDIRALFLEKNYLLSQSIHTFLKSN